MFDTADRLGSKAFQCEDVGVLLRILNNAAAESISEARSVKNSEYKRGENPLIQYKFTIFHQTRSGLNDRRGCRIYKENAVSL